MLRDLVQNFYDSIGYKKFARDFSYKYLLDGNSYSVNMETKGHSFSLDLLCYMGASTKTGKTGYAGHFGEGFKVCAVSLMRMGIRLEMESGDWSIIPESYGKKIDGKMIKMLGYRKSSRLDDGITRLKLVNVPISNERWLKEALLNFYYPENPLLGEKVASGSGYAVYKRSVMKIPSDRNKKIDGILYYKYIARAELPFPFVFFIENMYRLNFDSRDRDVFETYQVIAIITTFAERMDSISSLKILEELKQLWCELPSVGRKADIKTWYYFICQLVRNVARSTRTSECFRKKYSDLVYLERRTDDISLNRRIDSANRWYRENKPKIKYVNPIFRKLGATPVLAEYEKHLNELVYREPSKLEGEMLQILDRTFRAIWCYERDEYVSPKIKMYSDLKKVFDMEFERKCYGYPIYIGGFRQKYEISYVIVNPDSIKVETFKKVFIEYVNCILHMFGTDRSEGYTVALTDIGARIIENYSDFMIGEVKWKCLQAKL